MTTSEPAEPTEPFTPAPTSAPVLAPLRCLWHELPYGPFCYQLAAVAIVEPGTSRSISGACGAHVDPEYWARRVTVPHELVDVATWQARGSEYRGRENGG